MITFDKKDFKKVNFDVGDVLNITVVGNVSGIEKDLISVEPTSVSSEIAPAEIEPKTPTADEEEETGPKEVKLEKTPTIEEEMEEEEEEE